MNKQEILDALLASNITDDDIKKAREKKKRDDEVRAVAAAALTKRRKAFISAFEDYMKTLSPTGEKLDLSDFEKELKEIEALAAEGMGNISINIKAGDRKSEPKEDYWTQMWKELYKCVK